jgi:N-acetylmuramoyl-L-alanine amidase
LRRFRSALLSLLFLMSFFMPQIGVAALDDNIPGISQAVAAPALKATNSLPQARLSSNNQLTNVRWLVHKDAVEGTSKLRLVIDTKDAVKVNSNLDGKTGSQLIINISGAAVGRLNDSVVLDGKIADKVRFIKKDNNNSQVVVDLSDMIEDSDYKVFTLKSDAINNKTFRVVVDINKGVPKVEYNFTAGLRNKVIAIDPGHGGSDPGAIGPNKLQEKTATLAIAQKVQALLERAGAKVLMTRKTDVDVFGPNASAVDELNARAVVANTNKADVFVSLHINAFTSPAVGGTATYYYQKSNYDILLANCIQDNLIKTGGLQDRGINAAGFYVIKKAQMPSVLAELGFISNPNEEKLLSTPQFQEKMAQGVVQGLDAFFAQAAKKGGGL